MKRLEELKVENDETEQLLRERLKKSEMLLSKIREDEGKIDEAAKILQEVQVETFGTMKVQEKTEYILEQMRLCLKKKDFVRAQIISKKINPKVFMGVTTPEGMDTLKIRFNHQLIEYYKEQKSFIEIAKCYWEIYETVKGEDKLKCLKLLVIFLILAPHSNEQSDFINRVNELPLLSEKLPEFKAIVKTILTIEVITWKSFFERVEPLFIDKSAIAEVFKDKTELELFWEELRLRIIEHNIRVVEKYYKRITTKRLSALLSLNDRETEQHLGRMVVSGSVYAKIDRPHGIINFRKTQTPSAHLNNWTNDIDSLLKIVENSCHLTERENMIYKLNQ